MAHVRELPPLRLSLEAETPSGRKHRWAPDERRAEDVFSGYRQSSTMPGGFEGSDCTLPRKPGVDYSDLERLTTIRAYGAGGRVAGECRLERTPRVSGDHMAISPSTSGWQQHLEDNKFAREIYVDRDLSKWQAPSAARQTALYGANALSDQTFGPITDSALPGLQGAITFPQTAPKMPVTEGWYLPGLDLESVYVNWLVTTSGGLYVLQIGMCDDDIGTSNTFSSNLATSLSGTGTFSDSGRALLIQWFYNSAVGTVGAEGQVESAQLRSVAVYGDHGLTKRGTAPEGFYASDIVGHAVGKYAPLLVVNADSIDPSGFLIEHLAFLEPTTGGEIVRRATRFGLQDWAVWENREFVWHNRGSRGRRWRARIAPSQLDETGPQVDRLWESVVVQYQDVDGSTRTAGPTGSGADTESDDLHDSDPDNPANKLGITRRALLVAGVMTAAGATELGRRFLAEQKLLDTSGRASLVGHVQDDRGVMHPAWAVRAGDYIEFIDANDKSARRIVKADYSHDSRTCSVDLDAPPEGLAALLERLGVVLVPLGF